MAALLFNFAFFFSGMVLTWFIARHYYNRTSKDQRGESDRVVEKISQGPSLSQFAVALESDDWEQRYLGTGKVWLSDSQPQFQIRIQDDDRPFDEPWSRGFLDPNATCFSVRLSISNVEVKQITFVSLDGCRITVPLPKRIMVGDERHFFWDPESLEFKVGSIVGSYDSYRDIEGVARRCSVEIIKERRFDR